MFSFLQVLKLLHVNDVEFNINNVGGRLDNSHRFSMMTLYIVLVEGRGPRAGPRAGLRAGSAGRGPGRAAKFGPHATLGRSLDNKTLTNLRWHDKFLIEYHWRDNFLVV